MREVSKRVRSASVADDSHVAVRYSKKEPFEQLGGVVDEDDLSTGRPDTVESLELSKHHSRGYKDKNWRCFLTFKNIFF